jgi:hypothetical protein
MKMLGFGSPGLAPPPQAPRLPFPHDPAPPAPPELPQRPAPVPDAPMPPVLRPLSRSVLDDVQHANDQAVLNAIERVRAAQKAVDNAAGDAYTHGPGSQQATEAKKRLSQLKQKLADALNELGKIPDFSDVDPGSVTSGGDGHVAFSYLFNGQRVWVTGALKNGTGELYDQGRQAYYSHKDGQFVGARFLDEGRAIAVSEPLLSAIAAAVGAPGLIKAGEAGWVGLRALLARLFGEAGADLSADEVLPSAVAAAEMRAEIAAHNVAEHAPTPHAPAIDSAPHAPPSAAEAPHPPADAPLPNAVPPAASGPEFTLDNPLDYLSPDLQRLSEQHLTGSGETVLGPYAPAGGGPSYIDVAQQHGASYFDIGNAWNTATPTERLAANQHVLDAAIANRDTITLSVPFGKIDPNTFTGAEIRYLESYGYQRIGANTLAPPTGGRP